MSQSRTHRTTEWFGLEGPLKIIQTKPPAMGRNTLHQTRLLKAPSSLALNTAREGQPQLLWATCASASPSLCPIFITDNDSIQLVVLISGRLKAPKRILIPVGFLFDPMPQNIIMQLQSLTTKYCRQNKVSDNTKQSEQTPCNYNILDAKTNPNLWKYQTHNLPVSIFDISADADVWDGKVI